MLSGKLLKEFVERSWNRDELNELAWPSLDTVSQLQIISELQDGGNTQLSDVLLSKQSPFTLNHLRDDCGTF